MGRACGLESYKGEKVNVVYKLNFGKTMITECPNSYCSWDYVGDSLSAYAYYEAGFLPEVYDEYTQKNLSILDQSEFFTFGHSIVGMIKNKYEAKRLQQIKGKS